MTDRNKVVQNKFKQQHIEAQLARVASTTNPEGCTQCGNTYFMPAARIKLISALSVGAPHDIVYQENVQICTECKHVWTPGEVKNDNKI